MVRPERFELPAFWFVGKRYRPQGLLFNNAESADMLHFGAFGVNWVGISVGVFRGAEISTRPSGSARLGGSAQNPDLVRGPGGRNGHFTGESWIELSPSHRLIHSEVHFDVSHAATQHEIIPASAVPLRSFMPFRRECCSGWWSAGKNLGNRRHRSVDLLQL